MADEEYVAEERGRRETSKKVLARIAQHKQQGVLLDIGCANGFFLDEARKQGWDTRGVEISTWAAAYGRNELKLNITNGFLEEANFPAEFFDVIVMLDVIEHLTHPKQVLLEIKRILKPQGVVYISTPDIASTLSRLLGAKWWGINKYHLFYFSKKTFETMINSCGFQVKKYHPHVRIFSLRYWIKRITPYHQGIFSFIEFFVRAGKIGSQQVKVNLYDQIEAVITKKESFK